MVSVAILASFSSVQWSLIFFGFGGAMSMWASPLHPKGSPSGSLCTYALRVPAVAKSSLVAEASRRHRIRSAIVNTVNHIMTKADEADDIWASVQDGMCTGVKSDVVEEKTLTTKNFLFRSSSLLSLALSWPRCRTVPRKKCWIWWTKKTL